jgi:hypothetical protein
MGDNKIGFLLLQAIEGGSCLLIWRSCWCLRPLKLLGTFSYRTRRNIDVHSHDLVLINESPLGIVGIDIAKINIVSDGRL